jgi:hypothetical protein
LSTLLERLSPLARRRAQEARPGHPPAAPFPSEAVPHGTDWAWRPALWAEDLAPLLPAAFPDGQRLAPDMTLFHDGRPDAIRLARGRPGLLLELRDPAGAFLSIAIDLPPAALSGLHRGHLIRATMILEAETELDIFARLNVRHGPNTSQLLRKLGMDRALNVVEFDLAYAGLNEKRIDHAWLDLIVENPPPTSILIGDLIVARLPRAAF